MKNLSWFEKLLLIIGITLPMNHAAKAEQVFPPSNIPSCDANSALAWAGPGTDVYCKPFPTSSPPLPATPSSQPSTPSPSPITWAPGSPPQEPDPSGYSAEGMAFGESVMGGSYALGGQSESEGDGE